MIPYILYASIILSACLIFYKLLLQKETFFSLNRIVLLSCMALAFVLPLLPVPQQMSFRKETEVMTTPVLPQQNLVENINRFTETAKPETVADNSIKSINTAQVMQWLGYLYWFGVLVFGFNFLMQTVVLFYRAYTKPVIRDGKFRIVEISGDKAPCSFANNIFINPEKYDWETYNQVLLHEKIHIEQKHTLDLLLAEIMIIFQWFNPFAWQWRKELETNLEFFTDEQMLQKSEVQKENYQLSLLRVAAPQFPLSLTTNYNQSLLKKRLIMMNSKKSNIHTTWKYFFLLPMMVLFVCLFNEPLAQSKKIASNEKLNPIAIDDNTVKTTGIWFATIKNDKVSIQFKDEENEENNTSGITFQLNELGTIPQDKQGNFTIKRDAGTMEFTGKFEGNKGMGNYRFRSNETFKNDMIKDGVNVKGENDLIIYFMVNINRSFVQMLKKQGYSDLSKDNLIPLAALNINEAYISSIKAAGFNDISIENLITFKSLNIDKVFIDEIRKAGYTDLSPDRIITLKAQGIDGKYIAEYRNASKSEDRNKDNKNKNQEGQHNNAAKMDEDEIIAFKSMNITNEFINSIKELGYNNISNSDLIAMKSLGVTADFIKNLQNAGYAGISADDIIAMKSLGVSVDFIKSFRNAGYDKIKADDLVALKSQNISPGLINEYRELGFNEVNIDDVVGAKATGTTPAFIKSMREKGHHLKTLDKYIALKSVIGN